MGEIAFQSQDVAVFLLAVLLQGEHNPQVLVRGAVARRGLLGPIHDFLEGTLLEADVGRAEGLTQGDHACVTKVLGRGEMLQQVPGDGAVPEFILGKAGGEAR